MSNINFVPDDYVQSNESRRANLMCLVLFSVVMAAWGGSFVTIKIRQRACNAEEALVNAKMARMQEAIKKFEELQTRRKEMMRTALTTAELIEPVPRSVVLASLTNNLPAGVSLVKLNLIQKEPGGEKQLDTNLTIEGMAPSDLQVAAYIEQLGVSSLLTNVALVESKEKKIDETSFRHFKLTAMLSKEIHLTKEDVEEIKAKAEHSIYHF